uniref:Uncharacterized protein n=1 Tax=Rhipicephalus appendiculatus TaxID=34631 RepID=A0A131YBN0_RHIAP
MHYLHKKHILPCIDQVRNSKEPDEFSGICGSCLCTNFDTCAEFQKVAQKSEAVLRVSSNFQDIFWDACFVLRSHFKASLNPCYAAQRTLVICGRFCLCLECLPCQCDRRTCKKGTFALFAFFFL